MMKLKLLLLITSILSVQILLAQHKVSGTLTDAKTGVALIGATIIEKGTTNGTTTNVDGNFSLEVANENVALAISYVGYTTQELVLNGQEKVNLALEVGEFLDEVVVTALGLLERKSRLTYATQRVDSRDLNVSRVGDAGQQLSGQVPGLAITTSNGSAVQSSRVILRGESSLNINRNQPLLVVDGALISNEYIGIGTDAHTGSLPIDYGNSLTDLNPDDFEDITVLKGPKARFGG